MRLSAATLPNLKGKVSVPSYNPSELEGGILHIGVGNFHRAHMATYLDDLFQLDLEGNKQWGIIGAGILSFDAEKRDLLEPQNWLQTVVERDHETENARVIGSMIDFLQVDYKEKKHCFIKEALANAKIKIVSLTVTEGGYFLCNGAFDPTHPLIRRDIENPYQPETIFGMMVLGLKWRKESGQHPFTVLSCDNIPHNGDVVRSVVVGLASQQDKEFGRWIDENVAFPNSMVDRITPATSDVHRQYILEKYEFEDASPIFCEPFRQWVLEDKFPQGRPKLELLDGISFVPDVAPYEFMKIRILNGGHASLCYPSALLGLQFVHEAMEHPTIGPFLGILEQNEIIPSVPPVPNVITSDYWKLIVKRFSNPTICDTIHRICFDGSSRQPKFIVPVIADNLEAGRLVEGLALVSAMWCRYCQGTTELGKAVSPNDPQWDHLQFAAKQAELDPVQWLGLRDVYGEVGQHPRFVESFSAALHSIQANGVEAAMKAYITKHVSSMEVPVV